MNMYVKWFWVVGLNSILGFYFGSQDPDQFYIGAMISGILTWYFIYVYFDYYLQKTGHLNIRRKVFLSALLRIPVQFLGLPDMYAGFAAIMTVEFIGLNDHTFISVYCKTVFTGLYLSLICSVIYLLITGVEKIRCKVVNKRKT